MMNKQFTMINGVEVDVTTVFDTTVEYKPTMQEGADLVDEATELLNKYFNCLDDDKGLWKMFGADGEFWKAKGWIIEAMKKHPNYNGRYQIILRDQDMHRYLDSKAIRNFSNYVCKYIEDHAEFEDPFTGEIISDKERFNRFLHWDSKYSEWRNLHRATGFPVYLSGRRKANIKRDKYYYLSKMPKWEFVQNAVLYICDEMMENEDHLVTEEMLDHLNTMMNIYNGITIKGIRVGHKVSKVMRKICDLIGITSHTDIQDASFYRQDGTFVQRTKDMGWNYQYAQFCDGVNPTVTKGTAVISVNPIDFWTMSFGYHWASCHTIDKENRRRNEHNYSGCYCGGTESYMGDKASIIFYFLPDTFNGDHPELEDKIKRCVFYLGEDKLIQSRVYPDGRDGGDKSLAGDIRAIMQKVVAQLWDVPNYWDLAKGNRACREVTRSYGPHYRDYEHYSDCNVSYLKRIDGYKNVNRISIGTDRIICPSCGEAHYSEENIFCGRCLGNYTRCAECGEEYDEDDMHYINGNWYCPDCVSYCYHCGDAIVTEQATETNEGRCVCDWCRDRYYVWSDYDFEYVHEDNAITTVEDHVYVEGSSGYSECSNCYEYHDSDELIYDEESDRYYCRDCYDELIASREEQLDHAVGE